MKYLASTVLSKIHRHLRPPAYIWRVIRVLLAAVCVVVAIYPVYAIFHFCHAYAELPNGVRLERISGFQECRTFDQKIVLKNAQGKVLSKPDVIAVVWNERYIRGYRYASEVGRDIAFVYRLGDESVLENVGSANELYKHMKQESNLPDSVDAPYKNVSELLRDPRYRRAWYR